MAIGGDAATVLGYGRVSWSDNVCCVVIVSAKWGYPWAARVVVAPMREE